MNLAPDQLPYLNQFIALALQSIAIILTVVGSIWKIVNKKLESIKIELTEETKKRALQGECILKHENIDKTFIRINGNLENLAQNQIKHSQTITNLALTFLQVCKIDNPALQKHLIDNIKQE